MLGVYIEIANGARIRAGSLTRHADDSVRFDVDEAYLGLGPGRPILSAAWLAPGDEEKTLTRLRDPADKRSMFGMLPPWFKNLLPEGALRDLVDSQIPKGRVSDFDVLEWLGSDLPGAVIVLPEGGPALKTLDADGLYPTANRLKVNFALAGVQLKLSMLKRDKSLWLPPDGTLGDIIAKLPSAKLAHLPELEFSSMMMAKAAGIDVASCELVPVSNVAGVPEELLSPGPNVLALQRFDRVSGRRVHMEDFAQILGAVDNQKYTRANEETIMKMVGMFSECAVPAVLEAAARISVNIMVGNTDAHLKNWSFSYPGSRDVRLSPAYDIVAIYTYDKSNDMALKFQGTRSAENMGIGKFERTAGHVGIAPKVLRNHVKQTVERAADTWPTLLQTLPIPNAYKKVLRDRWEMLALTAGLADVFR